jgi:hypothetical protein
MLAHDMAETTIAATMNHGLLGIHIFHLLATHCERTSAPMISPKDDC